MRTGAMEFQKNVANQEALCGGQTLGRCRSGLNGSADRRTGAENDDHFSRSEKGEGDTKGKTKWNPVFARREKVGAKKTKANRFSCQMTVIRCMRTGRADFFKRGRCELC